MAIFDQKIIEVANVKKYRFNYRTENFRRFYRMYQLVSDKVPHFSWSISWYTPGIKPVTVKNQKVDGATGKDWTVLRTV